MCKKTVNICLKQDTFKHSKLTTSNFKTSPFKKFEKRNEQKKEVQIAC